MSRIFNFVPFKKPESKAAHKRKIQSAQYLIRKEIDWTQEHLSQSGNGPEWESGYLTGLKQAAKLIRRATK